MILSIDASKIVKLKSIRKIYLQFIDQPMVLALLEPTKAYIKLTFTCFYNIDAVEQYWYFNQVLYMQKSSGVIK